MKKLLIIVCALMLVFSCVGCDSSDSTKNTGDLTLPAEPTRSCNPKAISELKAALNVALYDFDTSVLVFDNGGALHISITITGAQTINSWAFGLVVSESAKEIEATLERYEEPIDNISFTGMSESRIIKWTTTDLKTGRFSDILQEGKSFVSDTMSIDEVLEYCGYGDYKAPVTDDPAPVIEIVIVQHPGTVGRNEYATLTIKGKPNTEYTLRVRYSEWSTADGLGTKISDADGYVTWTWKIGGRTSFGSHDIEITGDGQKVTSEFTVADK